MEPFFLLGYYFGMDWNTYYTFPVSYRRWLIKRINKEIQTAKDEGSDTPTKAAHHNTQQARELTGKFKPFQTNAKNWRATE